MAEGEYGTSASGPIDSTFGGSSNFTSPNGDEYAKKGIRSTYQSVDLTKKKVKSPLSDRANAGSHPGVAAVSDAGLRPWTGTAAGAV